MDVFREQGHHAVVVPHKNWLRTHRALNFIRNVIREWQAAGRIQQLIDETHPDLVYVNTGASLAGAWAARKAGLPCVWHLRELFSDVQGELVTPPWGRPVARQAFRRLADRRVAPSRAVAVNLLDTHAKNVAIIPNAAGERFFVCPLTQAEARQQFGLPAEGLVLGVPGTLRPMKGHPFLFEALPAILEQVPALTVAVTGGGQPGYVEELYRLAEKRGLSSSVRFLGVIEDMSALLRASDVACIPSVAEPFGRTVIEAFAVGTPVVATDVGGIRETVDEGETGLRVPYGDTQALTDALLQVLCDPALRATLAENAREKALRMYHEQSYKKAIVGIGLTLVGEKHREQS